jgi:hypothetical protein
MLDRLLQAATKVYHAHRDGRGSFNTSSDSQQPLAPITDDELAIFGGHTRLRQIESKPSSAGSPSGSGSSASAAAAPSPPEKRSDGPSGVGGAGEYSYPGMMESSPLFSDSSSGAAINPLFFDSNLLGSVSDQFGAGTAPSLDASDPSNLPLHDMQFAPSQPQSSPPSISDQMGIPGDWVGLDAIMNIPYWSTQDFTAAAQPGWPGSGLNEQQGTVPAMNSMTAVPDISGAEYSMDNRSVANAQWMSFLQETGIISRDDGMNMMFGSDGSGDKR